MNECCRKTIEEVMKIIGHEIITCPEEMSGWNLCGKFITANETTCTPIYNTTTYGCQTGDAVRKASELIR